MGWVKQAIGLVVLTATGLVFLEPLLRLFGASDQVLPFGRDYLQTIVLGTVFQVGGFGLNAVIRGEGNPRVAMLTLLIGVVLNVRRSQSEVNGRNHHPLAPYPAALLVLCCSGGDARGRSIDGVSRTGVE